MRANFTNSFKRQAVEKALSRSEGESVKDVALSLGVGYSTLTKWINQAKAQELEQPQLSKNNLMTKEKRPQDWSLEEKLNLVIKCASLDDDTISELCREQGIFPHHIKQWKLDFVSGDTSNSKNKPAAEMKGLKQENKALKKELNRKDKALAEAAALLVLQKKVNERWGSNEDDSQ